jgi:hypothetical protein
MDFGYIRAELSFAAIDAQVLYAAPSHLMCIISGHRLYLRRAWISSGEKPLRPISWFPATKIWSPCHTSTRRFIRCAALVCSTSSLGAHRQHDTVRTRGSGETEYRSCSYFFHPGLGAASPYPSPTQP